MGKASSTDLEPRLRLLEDILENLPIGVIIMDRQGKVLMMNRWQEKTSRVRREQVLGSYFHEKWERLFKQGIMSDYWRLLEDGTPFQAIVHDIYPQFYNEKISAISRGAPLSDRRRFILLHDVSSEIQSDKRGLERLTKQLEDSSIFLANLIDSSPNVVITTDQNMVIKSVNSTGEKIFGYDKAGLIDRDVSLLFAEPFELDQHLAFARGSRPAELLCRKKSGEVFPARLQLRDIKTKDGRFQAMLFLLTDITWEKNIEEKLALSEKLALYSELMAGIAHQLNNPMVGVANFASLLLDKIEPDHPNRALVETIHEAAQKCQTMLSTMIKSLREPKSTFHSVEPGEVLTQALETVLTAAPRPDLVVAMDIPAGLPTILGDSVQLLEVFKNLLINALQAMPEGGRLEVRVRPDHKTKEIRIEISDTGPGVPADLVHKVFEPFFTTKKNTGVGLGLSFAYRVIKSHAGQIEVGPSDPNGAVFRVVLPIAEEKETT